MENGTLLTHKIFGKGIVEDVIERKDIEITYDKGKAIITEKDNEYLEPVLNVFFTALNGTKRFTENSLIPFLMEE